MPHFPLFIDLRGKAVAVIGGGKVALRKIQKLLPCGPAITVVAPEICRELLDIPGLHLLPRPFADADLEEATLVIAATGDNALNAHISDLCRARKIPVNVVDDPEKCTFLFPALVQRGEFSAGISTGGASPTAAAYFRQQLEYQLPEDLDEMLEYLQEQRMLLKETEPDPNLRSQRLRDLFYARLNHDQPEPMGSVALVGAGCGTTDLITVRGLRLLQQCQAVVYDDLIDSKLLDAAPESALRIYMGKRSGAHSAPQTQISQTLIDLARQGLRVVRLKGGDPYLFGRGGEEMLALQAAGISCQEVPGIPSPIGIPAQFGIPVTHRGLSRGLHIVTAHTSDTPDGLPEDFDTLARLSGTLVFLMGLSQLSTIAERLIAAGKSPDTPAAVLSGGNAPNPNAVRAPLRALPQAARAAEITSPAIILVGEVAELDLR